MSAVVFGHDDQPGGVFVEPMNDPWPALPPHTFDLRAVIQHDVDQRPVCVAGRRMHYHARRLVNHQQVFIFIDDDQRNLLGLHADRRRCSFGQ